MPRRKTFSLRLVRWFFVLAILPAIALATIAYVQLRRTDDHLVLKHLQTAASTRAEALGTHLAQYRNHTALLARHDLMRFKDRIAELGAAEPEDAVYGLAEADGTLHIAVGGGHLDSPDLGRLRAGTPVLVGDRVFVGTALDDGGACLASVPLARLLVLLEDVTGLMRTGETYLLDADGRILGGNRPELRLDAADAYREGWRAEFRAEPGIYLDYRGREVLGAHARVGPWTVVAEMDRAEAAGPLRRLGGTLLGIGLLVFLLPTAFLLRQGRRTERALHTMIGSIEKAGRAEFGGAIGGRAFPEIEHVRDAINTMHQRLAERDGEIMKQRQELFCQRCELERLNAEIVQADRMKTQFVANMSHEVRTPLHSILTLSGVLMDETSGKLNGEQRKQVGIIERSGKSLLAMLGDILDFSKIEAGRVTVMPSEIAPGAAVADVREAVAQLAQAKGLALKLDIADGLAPIRTDPEKLHRILLNLAHNAVKFTKRGSVTLRCLRRDGGGAVFEVTDTGPGIPAGQLDSVFEPFNQLDSSLRREAGGTGLGLTIAKSLTELLGGRIAVLPAAGGGTAFQVVLPGRIPVRAPAGAREPGGADDVLVVGASPPSGDAIRGELRAAGFYAGRAVCGRDVRTAIERYGVETILLDAGIFENEGVDVFSHLADRLAARHTRILGYWLDQGKREGGCIGELAIRPAADGQGGFELQSALAAPLSLPDQVTEDAREAGIAWTRALRATEAEPLHAVVRSLVQQLDTVVLEGVGQDVPRQEILLLDPDPDARYSVSLRAERFGHGVVAVGELASVPADCRPTVIVTETRLPDADDAVEKLRARFDVPIIVCTADARDETHNEARRAGADEVLVKPVPIGRLLRAMTGGVKA